MQISRGKIVIILILMSLSIGMLVYSFAYTTVNNIGENTNYLTVSEIMFNFKDSVKAISLDKQTPTIDKFGLENEPFTFSISNDGDKEELFTVRLVDLNSASTINNENIRYQLTINGISEEPRNLTESGVIDSGAIKAKDIHEYSLKVWLSEESNVLNGVWRKVIKVEAGTTNIDASGANAPKLTDNLIPVYYDKVYNVWRKADATNSNINYMWYDYESRMWANAVTVSEANRKTYVDSVPGIEIKMEDINSMWVWIPRYKYVVFNSKGDEIKPLNIKVMFERGNKNTASVTCTNLECTDKDNDTVQSGKSTYTKEAFIFGDEELTGIWVSKFSASPATNTACYENISTNNCNKNNLDINIKPNLKVLSNVNMVNLFTNFRRMELKGNIYGFKGNGTKVNSTGIIENDDNDIDIHMIKNSEWDAIIYLYHSQYGKYGNINYENKEIYLNPGDITGTSYGDSIETDNKYKYDVTNYGVGASTTGNIYGVYDLNSTIDEIVMANLVNENNEFVTGKNEGFKAPYPDNKYYDSYLKNNFGKTVYSSSFETRKWYGDSYTKGDGYFITRGNNMGNETNGVFGVNVGVSANINRWTSRPVLKVTDTIYITKW